MQKSVDLLCSVNSLLWAKCNNLLLRDGVPFDLYGLAYLDGIINNKYTVRSIKKGAQVCLTTALFIEAVHRCVFRHFEQNIIYMMPTSVAVERLSKVSFDPIFRYNPCLSVLLEVDSTYIKTINGRSIVFVGSQPVVVNGLTGKDNINLHTIGADCVYRDEIDNIDPAMVQLSKQRLQRSKFGYEVNWGTPTIPDYGIDSLYEAGNQCKWQIKCSLCGKHTHLATTFPKCVRPVRDSDQTKNALWVRCCVHCGAELNVVADGSWVPDKPDSPFASFWVEALLTPDSISGMLDRTMQRYNSIQTELERVEFERAILGIASVQSSAQILWQDILACVSKYRYYPTDNACYTVMGIDVGSVLHYVIGIRTGADEYQVISAGTAKSFDELYELAYKFNVRVAVVDAMPDIHATKEFATKAQGFKVYRCYYSEHSKSSVVVNNRDDDVTGADGRHIKVNRNEWCDKVYDVITSRRVSFVMPSNLLQDFATQMSGMVRVLENTDTGGLKCKWLKRGDDHYFHAFLYFLVGCSMVLPVSRMQRYYHTQYYSQGYAMQAVVRGRNIMAVSNAYH